MGTSIFDAIEVTEHPARSYVSRSTTDDMTAFEAENAVKLPASYREFCLRFGAGELSEHYRIAAPMDVRCNYALSEFHNAWSSGGRLAEYGSSHRLYLFATTIGGDGYAWDISDVTDAVANEYSIYFLPRDAPMERVADSFGAFVKDVCLAPDPSEDWFPEPIFRRFYR